jgi:hypothetical protein
VISKLLRGGSDDDLVDFPFGGLLDVSEKRVHAVVAMTVETVPVTVENLTPSLGRPGSAS